MSTRRTIAALGAMLIAAMPGAARLADTPAPHAPPGEVLRIGPARAELEARLERLDTSDPEQYFLLGEDIAGMADDRVTLELARRLHVLALSLSLDQDDHRLSASACLALAALSTSDADRRWLRALAAAIGRDTRAGDALPPLPNANAPRSQLAIDVATAIGMVRAGEGRKAARLMDQPGAWELLESAEGAGGALRGADAARIRRDMDAWPTCPQCGNERRIRKMVDGQVRIELCLTCSGDPGPILTPRELIAQLRMESFLLGAHHMTWGAQGVADSGAPLRELDPREVARAFRIDPTLSVYRDGTWTRPDTTPDDAPAPGATLPPSPE